MTSLDLAAIASEVDRFLAEALPEASRLAPPLVKAMRYAVVPGGKRLRPSLVCTAGLALGAPLEKTLPPAAAVELIHAYSLVHDDLPALDNDALRRGKPSAHIAFGEAHAILVGDALQTLAFQVIAEAADVRPGVRVELIRLLAVAAGWQNMVGGQCLDISPDRDKSMSLPGLERLHLAKTGALIRTSLQMGGVAAGHIDPESEIQRGLGRLGDTLGLGFQIIDDLLDATRSTEELGKPAGSDARSERVTFVTLVGIDGARARAERLLGESRRLLRSLDLQGSLLERLAVDLIKRDY